jgi:CubicO group peptidase (beta-lactamase class C family)
VAATNSAWYHSNLTRPQLLGLVKHMKLDAPFRTRMVYSNVGYTIAGEAAAAATGTSWEDLITQRIIAPLGMTRTSADYDAAPAMGNCASGHAMLGDAGVYEDPSIKGYEQRPTPRETTRKSIAPAGSIQSSVSDLAKWMIFQLGDGTHEGRRIISAESMEQMHTPQVIIRAPAAMRAARQVRFFPGYGLGWQVMDYRGHPLLWHSGAGDGQRVYMVLLPEEKLGVVVLLNSQKIEMLHGALVNRIIDHFLELPTRDYCGELREPWQKDLRAWEDEARRRLASRRTDTRPSLPLGAYAGTYRDQLGLEVVIAEENGGLVMRRAGGQSAKLEHWHDDEFMARWENPLHASIRSMLVSFEIDEANHIARLRTTLGRDAVEAVRGAAPTTGESGKP